MMMMMMMISRNQIKPNQIKSNKKVCKTNMLVHTDTMFTNFIFQHSCRSNLHLLNTSLSTLINPASINAALISFFVGSAVAAAAAAALPVDDDIISDG